MKLLLMLATVLPVCAPAVTSIPTPVPVVALKWCSGGVQVQANQACPVAAYINAPLTGAGLAKAKSNCLSIFSGNHASLVANQVYTVGTWGWWPIIGNVYTVTSGVGESYYIKADCLQGVKKS